ncbi:nucleotide-diphospho-sugar transferases superfamily protein [Actinidia rufa]|uniref:Nucleotide-diphospho-sugar transferases superfamily protein n=1 Tax=Actinidia rufa TaxID=165716 RepID=A0A7J0GVV5_9ERIC|nr:nucleotide-diphospho-sugar transferases superfamily protein [Actinidia rufa]
MRGSLLSRRTVQRFRQVAISAVGPVKIKLLLCCCVIFGLIVFGSRMASFMGWKDHTDLDQASGPRKGYALLINTWKRNDLLKQSISHYTSCHGLDSIHIVWSEPDPPSDNLVKVLNHILSLLSVFGEVHLVQWWDGCPVSIRLIKSNDNAGRYIYGGWWTVWWTGTYSMILSKAAFFHKKYLSLYTNEMPASIREYVAKNSWLLQCIDRGLQNIVAFNAVSLAILSRDYFINFHLSGLKDEEEKPAKERQVAIKGTRTALDSVVKELQLMMNGKIFEIGSTGISSLGGHIEKAATSGFW